MTQTWNRIELSMFCSETKLGNEAETYNEALSPSEKTCLSQAFFFVSA